jgi:predicted O-methyltransferase YrrM
VWEPGTASGYHGICLGHFANGVIQRIMGMTLGEYFLPSTWHGCWVRADKTGYGAYYEASLRLVRPGGLLVLDNTLRRGRVASPDDNEADTMALRQVNATIANDERVDPVLLPMASGMTLARRRHALETSGSTRVPAHNNKISN